MTSQINTLLDLMYNQLEIKRALTFRIKCMYHDVKENYPEHVLEDIDDAIQKKFLKKECDTNV